MRYAVSYGVFCSTTSLNKRHIDVIVDVIIRRAMICDGEGFGIVIKDGEGKYHIARILVYPKRKCVLEGVEESTIPGSVGSLEECDC